MKSKAFTLIELLVVTIVLTIIIGLSVPNFSPTYKKVQLAKITDDLAYLMRYGQSRAIAQQKHVRLEFGPSLASFWLKEEVDDEEGVMEDEELETLEFAKLKGRFGKTTSVPDGITIAFEGQSVIFFPDGSIEKEEIEVCNENRCFLVSTKGQRGHVRVFKVEEE